MTDIKTRIHQIGIVPVVKLDRVEDALPLAKALIEGYLPCAEVTFRTDKAKESIRLIADTYPEMLVGAGTVLSTKQVDEAIEAGAKFIVSPGLNPEVVSYCLSQGIPVFPGTANASDIEQALSMGLDVVKFFPAEINGGLAAINALSGPFPHLMFMPTGGVNLVNMMDYLASPKVLACGGSWMVQDSLIKAAKFDEIRQLSEAAVMKMLGFELADVVSEGKDDLASLSALLGLVSARQTLKEDLKLRRGTKGYLAIYTHSLERAAYFLEQKGFSLKQSDLKNIMSLDEEFAGLAIHFIQRG